MMITYQEIQSLYRAEKMSPTLQKVDESLYRDTLKVVSEVEEEYREQIRKLVDEIYRIRRNKILKGMMMNEGGPPLNAIEVEKDFHDRVVEVLKEHRGRILGGGKDVGIVERGGKEDVEVGGEVEERVEDDGMVVVRVVRPLPSFVGSDAKNYGPFNGGENIKIPRNTAIILIKQGMVEEI